MAKINRKKNMNQINKKLNNLQILAQNGSHMDLHLYTFTSDFKKMAKISAHSRLFLNQRLSYMITKFNIPDNYKREDVHLIMAGYSTNLVEEMINIILTGNADVSENDFDEFCQILNLFGFPVHEIEKKANEEIIDKSAKEKTHVKRMKTKDTNILTDEKYEPERNYLKTSSSMMKSLESRIDKDSSNFLVTNTKSLQAKTFSKNVITGKDSNPMANLFKRRKKSTDENNKLEGKYKEGVTNCNSVSLMESLESRVDSKSSNLNNLIIIVEDDVNKESKTIDKSTDFAESIYDKPIKSTEEYFVESQLPEEKEELDDRLGKLNELLKSKDDQISKSMKLETPLESTNENRIGTKLAKENATSKLESGNSD